jgi:UDP-sugar transporter A1/2/3
MTVQVTYQLKILTTAGFSVLLLGKRLTGRQWVSLLLLTCGVALVQVQVPAAAAATELAQSRAVGLLAVLLACFSSGFAGVYYEKLVKESSQPSLVIRNLQLGVFSLLFASVGMLYNDWGPIRDQGKRRRRLHLMIVLLFKRYLNYLLIVLLSLAYLLLYGRFYNFILVLL